MGGGRLPRDKHDPPCDACITGRRGHFHLLIEHGSQLCSSSKLDSMFRGKREACVRSVIGTVHFISV